MSKVKPSKSSGIAAILALYSVAALTIAAFGYGIGRGPALRAGMIYAASGLFIAFVCVGFAPRFMAVIALSTGMLGSMLRAAASTEFTSLFPKQTTINYLRLILTICGSISFGGGLFGGFRFTNRGLFNWVSRQFIERTEPISITDPSPRVRLVRDLREHFYASERFYFSLVTAFGSAIIAKVEIEPERRSLVLIALAVLVVTNLAWAFGAWLRPRFTVLGDIFRILQQMWEALAAFLVGYVAIIFIFSCLYAAAWQYDPYHAFRGVDAFKSPSFADFMYFSVVTMSTVGYGDVIPANAITRSIACIEVVLGVGWVTVVLGAAAALARPKVDQMLKEEWAEDGQSEPDKTAETQVEKAAR